MSVPKNMTEGTTESFVEMLGPCVDISILAEENDCEKINAVVFELYKEAARAVNLAAHLLDDEALQKGGWERNQAICAGLMIRICKFMTVVTQLSVTKNRLEVVAALNRSIMESAINLEFLVSTFDPKYFDQFVRFGLAPERDLYDTIQANIAARNGEVWPIEKRMLGSITDICDASGVEIEDVDRKNQNWAGTVRDRLKALNKEGHYTGMQRLPSHAVHGTWVDLYKNHLEYDAQAGVFKPEPRFSLVDARALGPVAFLVLEAARPYVSRFFGQVALSKLLLSRIDDLLNRILQVDEAHEKAMSAGA